MGSYLVFFASASHFFMNEFFAAPYSGLPALLTAFASQPDPEAVELLASASHFFMKDVLAAPASGLPALLTALVAQSDAADCAKATFTEKRVLRTNAISFDMWILLLDGHFELYDSTQRLRENQCCILGCRQQAAPSTRPKYILYCLCKLSELELESLGFALRSVYGELWTSIVTNSKQALDLRVGSRSADRHPDEQD